MWHITRQYIKQIALTWGPVIGAMAVMFIASAQPKYGPPGDVEALQVYFSGAMPVFPGVWEFAIKKSAHLIAFGVLGLLTLRALRGWHFPLRRATLAAVVVTAGYALTDELHQAFTPGRHPSGMDVGIDILGAVLFVGVAWINLNRQTRSDSAPNGRTQHPSTITYHPHKETP
jgi:VanZ family protein